MLRPFDNPGPSLIVGLTHRSTRTSPALPSALALVPAISATLVASVQAWLLSGFR
jgi:hypothetical protein